MAFEYKDYYQILGVPRGASEDEIRRAFRKLAREYHPDVAKDKRAAEERFKEINEAYEVLGDPEKRQKYDSLGTAPTGNFEPPPGWQRHRSSRASVREADFDFQFGGTGFSEFFERLFGERFHVRSETPEDFSEELRGARSRRRTGRDVQAEIMVTLGEVLHGAVRSLSLRRNHPLTGETEQQTLRVRIPPGVREGQFIKVPGQGEKGLGGGSHGDLLLKVRYARHPDFQVEGANLICDLELAPWEAVLGTTVKIPTLDGPLKLKIPPGASHGQKFRVRGQGLPDGQGGRGDLLATASIQMPKELSARERSLWEQLAAVSSFHPRSD